MNKQRKFDVRAAQLHAEKDMKIQELESALRPFAFGDPIMEQILFGAMDDEAAVTFTIRLGDCRAARRVLGESREDPRGLRSLTTAQRPANDREPPPA